MAAFIHFLGLEIYLANVILYVADGDLPAYSSSLAQFLQQRHFQSLWRLCLDNVCYFGHGRGVG